MALAKNKLTGVITDVPAHYINHPSLGKNLVAIDDVQAAPKKETKIKEQPAPEVELKVAEPVIETKENEE